MRPETSGAGTIGGSVGACGHGWLDRSGPLRWIAFSFPQQTQGGRYGRPYHVQKGCKAACILFVPLDTERVPFLDAVRRTTAMFSVPTLVPNHGGKRVAAIQEEILNEFLRRLGKSDRLDDERVKTLRALFSAGGKLKANDLVAVYMAAGKDGAV